MREGERKGEGEGRFTQKPQTTWLLLLASLSAEWNWKLGEQRRVIDYSIPFVFVLSILYCIKSNASSTPPGLASFSVAQFYCIFENLFLFSKLCEHTASALPRRNTLIFPSNNNYYRNSQQCPSTDSPTSTCADGSFSDFFGIDLLK